MSGGRGSAAVVGVVVMVAALAVVFQCEVAEAATYTVGGAGGWTFNVATWPKGSSLEPVTLLSGIHNVVAVDRAGYRGCTSPNGAKVYQTGNDQIKLRKGQNFFICTIAGHCQSGMKIAVTAV
ncbi:UNVERIFIED_CONTAM: Chemocyanin [Sesamum calycinum]|uniref:Chemocyanin n=1 Tax=Sesamum calycinum TaxID=2727403 RepID=A0AAW2PLK7_9LAMI